VDTYDLRAQDPNGAFGTPMLSVISGHYPEGAGQVALTPGLASVLHLQVGVTWEHDGIARTVVGIVQNPQSLLDVFALLAPGQVTNPTQVTVLFDATEPSSSLGPNFSQPGGNALNPDTIV
jgi:putative ABC transport system permease protein